MEERAVIKLATLLGYSHLEIEYTEDVYRNISFMKILLILAKLLDRSDKL